MNVTLYYRSADWETINNNARNLALHNLCSPSIKLPPGTRSLLGLGLNFCLKTPYPNINIEKVIEKFTYDTRLANFWANLHDGEDNRKYIKQLYIKNEEWSPPHASPAVEAAIARFAKRLRQEHRKYNNRWSKPNITLHMYHLLSYLKNHPTLIILPSDKNLGPVIMLRSVYIRRCLDDFLAKPTQYERLSEQQAGSSSAYVSYYFNRFEGSTYSDTIIDEIQTFFTRGSRKFGNKRAVFRAMPKIHKSPWALRPVIAKVGTTIECISKWLDYELQKLRKFIPTYIKDSRDYHQKITSRQWPAGTKIFTADASAMYDNIDIDHGVDIIKLWLESLQARSELPDDFPTINAIIDGLNFVMRNNVAQYGDCFFKQLCGTAMGTSVAVIYAGLYYGWHEQIKLLPDYGRFILDLSRFVDDMCVLWLGNHSDFLNFKRDVDDFGKLRWTMEAPSNNAIFLDLDITISDDGIISTKTYQKPQNLYLYIPPHSAHRDGMMKGIVYGELKRYHWQCTNRKDYVEIVSKFFKRCLDRNWNFRILKKIFLEADYKLSNPKISPSTTEAQTSDDLEEELEQTEAEEQKRDRLFLKVQFHPSYIPRQTIRRIYREECEEELRQEIGIERFTIAYSRAPNIGDFVTRSRLFEVRGEEVSTFLGE